MISFKSIVSNLFSPEQEQEVEPSNSDNAAFMVKAQHKLSGVDFTWLFDTQNELNTFMQEYCPKAHLLYVRTQVYRLNDGAPKLIERHEHCTGNVKFETDKFNAEANVLGVNAPRVTTYSNVSSAVTAVAYFA